MIFPRMEGIIKKKAADNIMEVQSLIAGEPIKVYIPDDQAARLMSTV